MVSVGGWFGLGGGSGIRHNGEECSQVHEASHAGRHKADSLGGPYSLMWHWGDVEV